MTAQSFAKLYAQLSKLLSELSEEDLIAVADGRANLALTIEHKGAAKKIGGTAKKAAKTAPVSVDDLLAALNETNSLTQALNMMESKKATAPQLKELAVRLKLPATGAKQALMYRLASHISSHANAQALRQA